MAARRDGGAIAGTAMIIVDAGDLRGVGVRTGGPDALVLLDEDLVPALIASTSISGVVVLRAMLVAFDPRNRFRTTDRQRIIAADAVHGADGIVGGHGRVVASAHAADRIPVVSPCWYDDGGWCIAATEPREGAAAPPSCASPSTGGSMPCARRRSR